MAHSSQHSSRHSSSPVSSSVPNEKRSYESSVWCKPNTISFPEWRGERHYMVPFTVRYGLPSSLARYQATVDQMLEGFRVGNVTMFLMIDESTVKAGKPHRRDGLHIDGYWATEELKGDDWPPYPVFDRPEALLLATSHLGSVGYRGSFDGPIGHGGSCQDVNISNMTEVPLLPNKCWAGNVSMLHESIPVSLVEDVQRTLVRINVPLLKTTLTECWNGLIGENCR